jgi:predicted permease
MQGFLQDIRYGSRMLAKSPGFAAVAVLSLGLGIGANTTIFSFVSALLFRPPAVESSSQLLELWNRNPQASGVEGYMPLSYPAYVYYRDHNQAFSGLLAFDGEMQSTSWSRSGEGQMTQGQLVSGNFFSILGVKPWLGRTFLPEEDQLSTQHHVVVLSHTFWRQQFNSDPQVLGKQVVLNGTSFIVIGVAPADFTGIIIGNEPDFWAPLAATPAFTHDPNFLASWDSFWLFGIGRLKPGLKVSQAQANVSVLSQQLRQAHPQGYSHLEAALLPVHLVPAPFRGYVAAFTGLLMVVVGLVLLIACANAANLVLAKAVERRREVAIRSALGASRGRLLRQALTESMMISLAGGAVGLLFAVWAVPPLMALKPAGLPVRIDVPIDWRVLAFTFLLALATGVVFGLAPAFRSAKLELAPALKDEAASGGRRRSRLRSTLVIGQVTVCTLLLISAGLCVRSLLNARSIDPGFDTRHVVIAALDPGKLGYTEAQDKEFYGELLARVESLPGVRDASLASHLPLTTNRSSTEVQINGIEPPRGQKGFGIDVMYVAPGFLKTMRIPLLEGREFTALDKDAVIINDAMARRFWPGKNAIGQFFQVGDQKAQVVGVMRTGKYRSLSEEPLPFMFQPFGERSRATLVIGVEGDPRVLLGPVRRAVQSLDPNVVPIDLETMKQYMALPLFPAHTAGLLLGAFGVLALVLAVTGLYGVISYAVGQRTHEIGVRLALGANRSDVLSLVLRDGMNLALVGAALGLLAAFAVTRVLSSLLYGIRPTDPLTYATVSLALLLVALLASYVPARRATKLDPLVALRHE